MDTILISEGDGLPNTPVPAEVIGSLAVHRALLYAGDQPQFSRSSWRVTHILTGHGVTWHKTRKDAVETARKLARFKAWHTTVPAKANAQAKACKPLMQIVNAARERFVGEKFDVE